MCDLSGKRRSFFRATWHDWLRRCGIPAALNTALRDPRQGIKTGSRPADDTRDGYRSRSKSQVRQVGQAHHNRAAVMIDSEGCLMQVLACPVCKALVEYSNHDQHQQLHDQQTRLTDAVTNTVTKLLHGLSVLAQAQHDLAQAQHDLVQAATTSARQDTSPPNPINCPPQEHDHIAG